MIDVESIAERIAAVLRARLPTVIATMNGDGGTVLATPDLTTWDEETPEGDLYIGGHPERPPRFPAVEISATRDDRTVLDLGHRSSEATLPIWIVVWDVDPRWSVLVRRVWRWGTALEATVAPDADFLAGRGRLLSYSKEWGTEVDPAGREGREPYVGWSIMTLTVGAYSPTDLGA